MTDQPLTYEQRRAETRAEIAQERPTKVILTLIARVRARRYRTKTAKPRWAYWLRTKYGLTVEAYEALHVAQGSRCAICRAKGPLVIDHCHTGLHVRGLLCNGCNSGLGYFRDAPERMRAAAEYIERTGGTPDEIKRG